MRIVISALEPAIWSALFKYERQVMTIAQVRYSI